MPDRTFVPFEFLDKYQKSTIETYNLRETHKHRFYNGMVDIEWLDSIVAQLDWVENTSFVMPLDVKNIFD